MSADYEAAVREHQFDLIEESGQLIGLNESRLLTNGAFATNIALYERVGYVVTAREPYMGGSTVRMSKRLAAANGPGA
jgi:hypothetical protein